MWAQLGKERVRQIQRVALTIYIAAAAAKLLQSCPPLCDPIDCSPLGSSIHGIFQPRVLEWVAIAFSAQIYYLHPNLCFRVYSGEIETMTTLLRRMHIEIVLCIT